MGEKPYYYSNDSSTLELDFVAESDAVYPIEVKAAENLNSKSIKTAINKNIDLKGIRFSMGDYREQEYLTNVPLYLVQSWVKNALQSPTI